MPSLIGMKMLIATKTYVVPLPTGTEGTDKAPAHTGRQQRCIHWHRYTSPNVALCYKNTQKFYCKQGAALSTIIMSFGKSRKARKMRISS